MSRPLQVYLDDAEFSALDTWANARGWSLSQAVRVALKALIRSGQQEDPLLAASGMIEGLPEDLSQRFDAYLMNTYVAEPPRAYRHAKPKRRAKKTVRR
ncbi:MAG: hypothetical protein K1X64_21165 [Myxococcaceae bacterium]|nr:hypothetical protein [Myxococcaceae bacterium]